MKKTDRYPLPGSRYVRLSMNQNDNVICATRTIGQDEEIILPICTPFGVLARLRRADEDDASGLRIRVQAMNGEDREADIARRELTNNGGQLIKSRLLDFGMRIYNNGEKDIINFLKATCPEQEIVMVSRRGWHWLPYPIFAAPTGEVFGVQSGDQVQLEIGSETESQGTVEGWRQGIETAVGLEGVQHWQIGAAAAFAGPIAQLCQLETNGIHFSGMTSRGKTLALRIAASAWSNSEPGHGLLSLWRSTDNAFEASAAASNGTIMALDEVKLANGKLVATTLFQLTSGTSKSRSNLKQTLQKRLQWTTFVVSSGEQSLKEKVEADDGKWIPGMSVRFTDVDVTDINSRVEKRTIDAILSGLKSNFGVAGPEFCEALTDAGLHETPEELSNRVQAAAKRLIGYADVDGLQLRAAMPLALVQTAGELAQEFGILPNYDLGSAVQWAWERYRTSSDAASLNADQNCLDALKTWIARNWEVSLKNLTDNHPPYRQADGWFDEECVYILADKIVEAAGIGLKRAEIARILDRHGLLIRKDGDRKTFRRMPGMADVPVFALDRSKMGPERMEILGSMPPE